MKRILTVTFAIVVVGAVLGGCSGFSPGQAAPTGTAAAGAAPAASQTKTGAVATGSTAADMSGQNAQAAAQGAPGSRVVADAKVVPVQSAELSMTAGGIVRTLAVKEGDRVTRGQLLIKLDDAQRQVAVAQAKANLAKAQATLAQLQAGARTQEIAAAEAGLAAAVATYQRLAIAAAPGSIAAAQAGVAQAQANLQKVLEGPSQDALTAALADVKNAEAKLKNATSAYNKVKDSNDIGMRPESLALEQATIAYQTAHARFADLQAGATAATIAAARAGVSQAAVQLDTAKKLMPSDLAQAQAAVDQAQAQVDLLKAGPRPEAIAIADAEVAAATAALQQTLVALADTELHAPFTGTVATVNSASGEQVAPGTPLILLADTTAWEIETSDLTEFDVVGVTPGDTVSITFDAVPDLLLHGTVARIRPIGEDNRGDTVYKVVVTPTQSDPRLLWNMTAVVEFPAK